MMNFSGNKHALAGFVCQSTKEIDPNLACTQDLVNALAAWSRRPNHELPGLELLHLDGCPHFLMSLDGEATDYWPNESQNDISETLIRESLFRDGICTLSNDRARLFNLKYKLLSIVDADCLLVCPYLTHSGSISGILVVLVTKSTIQKSCRILVDQTLTGVSATKLH
jgi:hypothetical protein